MTKKLKKSSEDVGGEEKIDIGSLKEFEDKILSLDKEKDGISYSVDEEMEAQIKFSVLEEKFGLDKSIKALNDLSINKKSLSDQDTYVMLYKYLQKNHK